MSEILRIYHVVIFKEQVSWKLDLTQATAHAAINQLAIANRIPTPCVNVAYPGMNQIWRKERVNNHTVPILHPS